MLLIADNARSPVPITSTGSLHHLHRLAKWTMMARPIGTKKRLKVSARVNVTREYRGGSLKAKENAATIRKPKAVAYEKRRSVSTGPSPKPGYRPASA